MFSNAQVKIDQTNYIAYEHNAGSDLDVTKLNGNYEPVKPDNQRSIIS